VRGGRVDVSPVVRAYAPDELEILADDPAPSLGERAVGWRERALVVGGDATCCSAAAGVLDAAGYEVRVAGTGREATRVLARWRPDVILLDLAGSGADGRALYAAHTRGDLGDVPLVVLGAPSAEEGAIVADPWDPPDLLAAVWVATTP
jgi:CheY-like chemotaxis protein